MNNDVNFVALEMNDNQKKLRAFAKSKAFDLIAVGLIISISLLNLGAIELRDINLRSIINIILEAVPFYLGAVSLALNYYKKGIFSGKSTDSFVNTVSIYSGKVNDLTGKQLDYLNDYCVEYNRKALKICQDNVLRPMAISFERFNNETVDEQGNILRPLKIVSYEELLTMYDKEVADAIQKAKNVKIKGLNANILLGNFYNDDITNLGPNEQELLKQRTKQYARMYAFSIMLMSLMAVKNILEWGWMGFVLVAFKIIYILCRSYMKYFEGYEDVTNKIVNHISRKIDILKQYYYWYGCKFPKDVTVTNTINPDII